MLFSYGFSNLSIYSSNRKSWRLEQSVINLLHCQINNALHSRNLINFLFVFELISSSLLHSNLIGCCKISPVFFNSHTFFEQLVDFTSGRKYANRPILFFIVQILIDLSVPPFVMSSEYRIKNR